MNQSDDTATAPFAYHGRVAPLLGIALVNVLLNVATLFIWRFWGKTRVRRYLWGQTTAWDDAIEYTGTGGELLAGFLLAMLVIFLPLTIVFGAAQALIEMENPLGFVLMTALQLGTVVLIGAGLYRARCYQLSRTVWRGIRGSLTGNGWGYGFRLLGVVVLSMLTLGWAWPWGEMALARYRMNRTRFGDQVFNCTAAAKGVYGRFAVVWGMVVAILAAISIRLAAGLALVLSGSSRTDADSADLFVGLVLLVGLPAVGLGLLWYRVGVMRVVARGTRFAGASFEFTGRTWPVLRLMFGNLLISLFSLGIAKPWAAARTLAFAAASLRVVGTPDFAAILQNTERKPGVGEGLAALMDSAGEF